MPLSMSAIKAAYSAAVELAFWSHELLVATREPDLPHELPDGRRVPHGSRFLAELARNVHLEATRDTHARRILDASDAILAANLSRGEYRIGEIVEATAHKAVLSYAQSLVNTAWNRQAQRILAGAEGPQDNEPDWPTTWAAAVWPTMRSLFAAQPILDWNAVRVALEREHAAATAALPRDQGEPGQDEGGGERRELATDEVAEEELTDRQRFILETMLEHGITSQRRRRRREDIVRLINRTHNVSTYGRDFAGLVKRGYLSSLEGSHGGCWLTPAGKTEAERLRSSN
jgi:hypothetical protein